MYKNWKISLLLLLFIGKGVYATGMAVAIDKLYLQNTDSKATIVHIKNLDVTEQNLVLAANSICKIDKKIMFLPTAWEHNNFVIMLQGYGTANPIVIDKEGNLALASFAKLKFNFSGDVKYYNFLGYCANKLQQQKLLAVVVTSDLNTIPLFNLKGCSSDTHFVYVINQNKQFRAQNNIDFNQVKPCVVS